MCLSSSLEIPLDLGHSPVFTLGPGERSGGLNSCGWRGWEVFHDRGYGYYHQVNCYFLIIFFTITNIIDGVEDFFLAEAPNIILSLEVEMQISNKAPCHYQYHNVDLAVQDGRRQQGVQADRWQGRLSLHASCVQPHQVFVIAILFTSTTTTTNNTNNNKSIIISNLS